MINTKFFYLGVRRQETGDNPPLTPPRRGREEGRGKREDVGRDNTKNSTPC
ncbi:MULTISPECIES: hypothetical protein [Okeania]|uniref:hypothetical protein n=1 Tax=Okeania TaxID=1458928 RepID=UPI001374A311|nr:MULTISPECIES: hypothetical protein [Okeania]NES75634.1 hypothetical protein [Okeania sp. SIO1H4]NET19021.1 hypothetical protein [Okeania sp. SIO1H5]NET75362.1 hypothetical protein [Okeania sp. SIO1F9]NET91905.1 hypothetical protein [Okeania sp. SIO1H2]